ncbi:Carbonic anhydrase, chloroplastic [Morella rubra]|uniref:Carbonic anhydrase, chloroplastic n=1 Tax=Morella rubra TaxID=262757 RepID=A0A6A1VT32_9ROSI|nr:Carbonic anhydrase, chloroplastic [Morella rubra]
MRQNIWTAIVESRDCEIDKNLRLSKNSQDLQRELALQTSRKKNTQLRLEDVPQGWQRKASLRRMKAAMTQTPKGMTMSMKRKEAAASENKAMQRWVKMEKKVSTVKVNVDAAIRENYAVIAAIICDSKGKVLEAKMQKIDVVDSLEGDAAVAKLGLELVRCQGFREISEWRIHTLVQQIQDLGSRLQSCKAIHVYRGASSMVHHLAHWAAVEYSSVGISYSCEHSLDLSWFDFIENWVQICSPAKVKVKAECSELSFVEQCTNCEKVDSFFLHYPYHRHALVET